MIHPAKFPVENMFSNLKVVPVKQIFRTTIFCPMPNPLRSSIPILNQRKFGTNRRKKDLSSFVIVRATRHDHAAILELMHESYYKEEPTSSTIGIKVPNLVLDQMTKKSLNFNMTLVAKCRETGEIVGACINESTTSFDTDFKQKLARHVKCPRTRELLQFYAYMQSKPNIFESFGVFTVFEMSYLFVNREHRRKGLALELMRKSREMAKNCGYMVVRVDATSHYTALLCQKLKMTEIDRISYSAFLNDDGNKVFHPAAPHSAVKIFVDDIRQRHF